MSVPAATFLSRSAQDIADPRGELIAGLMQPAAAVAPKYFYDRLGSALFTAITELPEYYPTRTEAAIFEAHRSAIAAVLHERLSGRFALVDLGAGDGAKAARLFDALRPAHYVAVDISEAYLRHSLAALQLQFPGLAMTGVGLDFARELTLPAGVVDGPALVFYPGSSIGNFAPDAALHLLRQAHAVAAGGALLIGVDLDKPAPLLQAAYDDALGVTAAFNLNLLRHLNRVLASDFELSDWRHRLRIERSPARVEMLLQAQRDLLVRWPGGERAFAAGETIHTENSHKWEPGAFEALLRDAGWRQVRLWTDEQNWFGVFTALA